MGSRSSVVTLPEDLRLELDGRLIKEGFSGYDELVSWLQERGHLISRSSLHRYGSQLQGRLERIREATLAAKAICAELPDDEAAVSEATLKLAQERLFDLLMVSDSGDPAAIVMAAKAVADAARAGVSVRKARSAAIEAEQARSRKALEKAGRSGQLDPEVAERALSVLGLS